MTIYNTEARWHDQNERYERESELPWLLEHERTLSPEGKYRLRQLLQKHVAGPLSESLDKLENAITDLQRRNPRAAARIAQAQRAEQARRAQSAQSAGERARQAERDRIMRLQREYRRR